MTTISEDLPCPACNPEYYEDILKRHSLLRVHASPLREVLTDIFNLLDETLEEDADYADVIISSVVKEIIYERKGEPARDRWYERPLELPAFEHNHETGDDND